MKELKKLLTEATGAAYMGEQQPGVYVCVRARVNNRPTSVGCAGGTCGSCCLCCTYTPALSATTGSASDGLPHMLPHMLRHLQRLWCRAARLGGCPAFGAGRC